jgi:hypothetical protein
MNQKICKNCEHEFTITDFDQAFYKHRDVPEPTLCPDCRQQRRISFRNERKLYKRKCALSGNEIISIYSPDKPYIVYGTEDWWSDKWDGLAYGRDFDFNKPFFEQFDDFNKVVPRPAMVNMFSENSLYTNHSAYLKNCYMCMNTGYCEDCSYMGNYNLYNKNCMDCVAIQNGELCYFCTNTKTATNSKYLYECMNCHDSAFLYDCHSCSNCFMCFNLRHKEYCIMNQHYSKEEYLAKIADLMPKTTDEYEKTFKEFKTLMQKDAIHKFVITENCENTTGDNIFNNKNAKDSYYTFGCEDVAYTYDCGELKDSLDVTEPFKGELEYETHACNWGYNLISTSKCYELKDCFYCQYCWNSDHLFGCFGLKKNKYCIFNKQYTKEEYETLVPKIIEHMKQTKEWGEFFPISMSPFCYNETIAQDYYPITKEEALKKGWAWQDIDKKEYQPQKYTVPQPIENVPDSIINEILACKSCKKNFKIIQTELDFYRRLSLPIPNKCYDCRHLERMNLRNPRHLWERKCDKCNAQIQSSYSPDRPEKVYCEKCYLQIVV